MDDDVVLLTDDEVVALCAIGGRAWPLGLITVGSSPEDVTQAGLRGARSLAVRKLMTQSADGTRSPEPSLAREVAAFADAADRIAAHIAPAADHNFLAGASVTAARTADDWLLDAATADGVHALRRQSADEAATAIVDFVEAVLDAARDGVVCVVRSGQDATAVSDRSAWNPEAVREAFGVKERTL